MLSLNIVIECLANEQHIAIAGDTESNKQTCDTNVRQKYCQALEQHLQGRFPDLPIISSFQIFDPALLPTSNDDMQKYGENYITELSHHYGIDDCSAQQEWANFRAHAQFLVYVEPSVPLKWHVTDELTASFGYVV